MLPHLHTNFGVEARGHSDRAVAVGTNVIADHAVVADGQGAAGHVLECNSGAGYGHGRPTGSRGDLLAATLNEAGPGDLTTAGAAAFGGASDGQSGGQKGEDDCGYLHLDGCVSRCCEFLKMMDESCSEGWKVSESMTWGPGDVCLYTPLFRVGLSYDAPIHRLHDLELCSS